MPAAQAGKRRLQGKFSVRHHLHDLVIRQGLTLWFLIRQLSPGSAGLIVPVLRIPFGIELRTAVALQSRATNALHHLILRLRQVVEGGFGRYFAGDSLPDILPPQLSELGVVGDIQTRGRPILDTRASEEL